MSAHDPKASMYAIVTTSTPKVAKPRSAMPTPSIGALLVAKGMKLGFSEEVATIAAMKLVASADKAAAARDALANPAPKPPPRVRSTLFTAAHHEKRKSRVLKLLQGGELYWTDLRRGTAFGRPVMQRVVSDLVTEGRVIVRTRRCFKLVRLAGTAPSVVVPDKGGTAIAPRSKPCVIDGMSFDHIQAAMDHFRRSRHVVMRWARTGVSGEMIGHAPCVIDGITFESLGRASAHFNVSRYMINHFVKTGKSEMVPPKKITAPFVIDGITFKTVKSAREHFGASYPRIVDWALTGRSCPIFPKSKALKLSMAFNHARTRKNSQTPSSGAISQSGAQMGGL